MLSASAYAKELAATLKVMAIEHSGVACRYVLIVFSVRNLLAALEQPTSQTDGLCLTCINKGMVA
jgi:hypothetical protein